MKCLCQICLRLRSFIIAGVCVSVLSIPVLWATQRMTRAQEAGSICFAAFCLSLLFAGALKFSTPVRDKLGWPRNMPGARLLKFLNLLRWPFGKETRETLDLLAADLKRDRKEMLAEGMAPLLVRLLLYCRGLRSLLPIALRELAVLVAVEELIRKIVGRG
jgi:hypothetical protein